MTRDAQQAVRLLHRLLRRALSLSALLGAGLATTVLIACLSALGPPPRQGAAVVRVPNPNTYDGFESLRFVRAGRERVSWGMRRVLGIPAAHIDRPYDASEAHAARVSLPRFLAAGLFPPSWGRRPEIVTRDQVGRLWIWVQEAHGWPMLALWCEWSEDTQFPGRMGRAQGGIDLEYPVWSWHPFYELRAVPFRPIWRGLVIDSLVYACGWLAVTRAVPGARRMRRRRRNLCPSCGYSLAGLAAEGACPECGTGVKS